MNKSVKGKKFSPPVKWLKQEKVKSSGSEAPAVCPGGDSSGGGCEGTTAEESSAELTPGSGSCGETAERKLTSGGLGKLSSAGTHKKGVTEANKKGTYHLEK